MALAVSNRAAAAKTNHQFATFRLRQLCSLFHRRQFRFARDGKVAALDAGWIQIGQRSGPRDVASRPVTTSARRPKFPGDGAGLIDRARAENDARGGGKFKTHNNVGGQALAVPKHAKA